MKPATTVKKQKPVTIAEFRAWLEGIEELGGRDWTPNASQWKKIKAKIALLIESTPSTRPPNGPLVFRPEPATFDSSLQAPRQAVAPPMLQGSVDMAPPPIAIDPKIPTKTPHIDTSHGSYNSPFAG
jgi:hypothetical protein